MRLPLAAPVIMAGVRTAAVITVGTATLAAFIGAGGLGDPIVAGLALTDTRMILSGAIPPPCWRCWWTSAWARWSKRCVRDADVDRCRILGMALLLAFLMGGIAGLRAMTAPAAVSWAARTGRLALDGSWLAFLGRAWTPWIFTVLALIELVTDQLPTTPSRTVPLQFSGRIVSGALCGAAIAARCLGYLAGAAGARRRRRWHARRSDRACAIGGGVRRATGRPLHRGRRRHRRRLFLHRLGAAMSAFDAIVVGAGQAGRARRRLTAAGMKVAIIERKLFGGTCVNTGCIPPRPWSPAPMPRTSPAGRRYGVVTGRGRVDMTRVMARARAVALGPRRQLEAWLEGWNAAAAARPCAFQPHPCVWATDS